MKAGVLAVAAALTTGAVAHGNRAHRHAHEAFHEKKSLHLTTGSEPEPTCGCTTIYSTVTGAPTVIGYTPVSSSSSAISTEAAPTSTYSIPGVPTIYQTVVPTPGTYTIPASTVTLDSSTTVPEATSTSVEAGTHTLGGVSTVVDTSTTLVVPYASITTSSGVVSSVILTTTYVAPSAGTHTVVAPFTTTVSTSAVIVFPTPATYAPGTYTHSDVVTTITETSYTVFCPFTSSEAPAPTSTYVAAETTSAPAPETTSEAPAPAPETTEAPAPAPAPETTSEAPAPAPSTGSKSESGSGSDSSNSGSGLDISIGGIDIGFGSGSSNSGSGSGSGSGGFSVGTGGDQWAITYTPYADNGGCKSSFEVYADVAMIKLKGFSALRVYSTDCSTLEHVGGAAQLSGLKMIVGVFISDSGIGGAQAQVDAITAWAKWDLVELMVVGNEAIFNGYTNAGELSGFISSCASAWKGAGYTGPITTTEPLNVWQSSNGALCNAVDVVGANLHPFFNSDVSCEDAGSFTKSQLDIADGLCEGKTGVNLETGWPSAGSANGKAVPGASEQATAIASIKAAVGGKSVMFSFTNDLWKPLGAFNCERSWGMVSLFADL